MRPLLALLIALGPAVARAADGPHSVNWGQGDPGAVHAVFEKVGNGAKREKYARDNQGWFSKLIGRDPSIEAKVELSKDYLPDDSPAVAGKDENGDPVVKVGRAALDATQSEGEMAFLLGHELHHTLVRARKRECLQRGRAKFPSETMFRYSPEVRKYQVDLEREADAWGQRYAANAGYNPLAAVDVTRHVGDLSEALGADPSADGDHEASALREERLKGFGAGALSEAACPW